MQIICCRHMDPECEIQLKQYFQTLSCKDHDEETHTGQSWDSDDFRRLRFLHDSPKQTNTQWPIDLVSILPTYYIETAPKG